MIKNNNRQMWRAAKSLAFAVMGFGALVLASGCGSQEEYGSFPAAPKINRVDWITFDHKVSFGANGASLTNEERVRFDEFLNTMNVGYADQISIGIEGAPGESSQTADKRVSAIRGYLAKRALRPIVSPSRGQGTWDGSILVTVGRYVVTPPECPNWEKPPGYDFSNTESSNLRCANTTNLGLMVADPGDLIRGRTMGPGDGTMGAQAVNKLRAGKSDEANASVTGTASGGQSTNSAGTDSVSKSE